MPPLSSPLLGAKPPSISVPGNVAAGVYSGLATFLDCAAFTSIVFASAGLPLSVGLQHALVGFVVMQLVVSRLSGIGYILVPISYEMMPFLSHFASTVAAAGASGASLLSTVLAGSVLVGLLGALAVALAAEMPVENVEALLPPALQAGLFGAIGWSIYVLAFEVLGLSVSLDAQSMLAWSSMCLWLPANLLGVGLWLGKRSVDFPLLFPSFLLGVSVIVHAVRLLTGTSLAEARDAGWLMNEAPVAPATQLWAAFAPSLIRWDLVFSPAGSIPLLCAALFGPVVNTLLNYILCGPLFKTKVKCSSLFSSLLVLEQLPWCNDGGGVAVARRSTCDVSYMPMRRVHCAPRVRAATHPTSLSPTRQSTAWWAARLPSRQMSQQRYASSSWLHIHSVHASALSPPSPSPLFVYTLASISSSTTSSSRCGPRCVPLQPPPAHASVQS